MRWIKQCTGRPLNSFPLPARLQAQAPAWHTVPKKSSLSLPNGWKFGIINGTDYGALAKKPQKNPTLSSEVSQKRRKREDLAAADAFLNTQAKQTNSNQS